MKTLKLKFEGVSPLLMHAGAGIDPTNPVKLQMSEITAKRKKTPDDWKKLKWLEFQVSLYWDEKLGVYVPASWVEGAIRDGAKVTRKGQLIQSGVMVMPEFEKIQLQYPSAATTIGQLYDGGESQHVDCRPAVVQRNRVMRTRPIFQGWAIAFELGIAGDVISPDEVLKSAEAAGRLKGLGDYRPRFGRFEVSTWS